MINQYRSLRLVMRREVAERVRSRVFLVSTVLLVILSAGGVVATVKLPNAFERGPQKVGIVGEVPSGFAEAFATVQKQTDVEIDSVAYGDDASGREALRSGDVTALLENSNEIVFDKKVDEKIESTLNQTVQFATLPERLAELGLTTGQLQSIIQPRHLTTTLLNVPAQDEGRKPSDGEQVIAAGAFALLLLATSIYGNVVFSGVIEEKSNRVVEVLLGALRPVDLLVGKVAGILIVGMVQMLLSLGAGVVALIAVGSPPDMPDTTFAAVSVAAGSFVLGLIFFSLAHGAMGAMVSRPEQASSNVPMAVFVGAITIVSMSLAEQPDSPILRILSFVPPTSVFLMPERVAIGEPPLLEIVAAALIMIGAIVALARACGRIYAGAILTSGQSIRLLSAWRSSKEAMQQ